jgi:NADP-dependent 3-hydroxy acid dehydrogenase YdfG
MEARRLHGRVALVTGASSGIGEATALALASEGARVAIIARRLDRLDRLADRIRENGGEALPIQTDVAAETQVSAAVDRVVDEFGRLDMLLAIAGVGVAAPFQGTTTSEYRQMFDVNVFGLLYSIAASLPIMKAQRDGHVVILSSGTGRYIHPSTVYSASKHAATAIAESLRREVCTDGIRVTSVEPGAVSTEFISQMRPDVRDAVEKRLGDMELLEAQD